MNDKNEKQLINYKYKTVKQFLDHWPSHYKHVIISMCQWGTHHTHWKWPRAVAT